MLSFAGSGGHLAIWKSLGVALPPRGHAQLPAMKTPQPYGSHMALCDTSLREEEARLAGLRLARSSGERKPFSCAARASETRVFPELADEGAWVRLVLGRTSRIAAFLTRGRPRASPSTSGAG